MSKVGSSYIIEIELFNPDSCSKESWDLYHEYRTTLHKQRFPDRPLTVTNKQAEKGLKMFKEHPEIEGYIFTIEDTTKNKQVGDLICSLPRIGSETYKENKHYMEFYINILENYHRKGIGTLALEKVKEVAKQNEKTLLATDTYYPSGKAFLETIGAELDIGIENRLQLENIDWSMVEKWVEEGPERSPKIKLVKLGSIPEDLIEQFSKIYTETYNQQPWDELDDVAFTFSPKYFRHLKKVFAETGVEWLVMVTIEEDEKISGLTEMRYNPGNKTMITQELTGVKEEYRGRGLGKWLKAAMLLEIKERFPDVKTVRTENATTNVPMLSINDRLGFKFFRESIEAQIKLEQLNKYLKQRAR